MKMALHLGLLLLVVAVCSLPRTMKCAATRGAPYTVIHAQTAHSRTHVFHASQFRRHRIHFHLVTLTSTTPNVWSDARARFLLMSENRLFSRDSAPLIHPPALSAPTPLP